MKNLIQSENYFFQSLNRLEEQMSHLINIVKDRNKKTLPNACLIIPNFIAILMKTKNHGALET